MIEFKDIKGPAKVVHSGEIEAWTKSGWALVAIFQDTDTSIDMRQDQAAYGEHGYTVEVNRHFPSTSKTMMALLVLDEESALADLSRQLEEKEAERKLSQEMVESSCKDREEARAERNAHETELQNLRSSRERMTQTISDYGERFRKMEADIAKLRIHFGEKAVKEVLGADQA